MSTPRPRVHLSAPSTWMNDPNGLILHEDIWHAFYQNNPFGSDHGHMTWAHATSRDLLRWEDHGPAICEEDGVQIYSGSVVRIDDRLVALYTGHSGPEHPVRGALQDQRLAISTDDGATWTKRAEAVVDRGSADFRDPKVLWHGPSGQWVMAAVEAQDRELLVHTSHDLITWEHTSTYRDERLTGIWECPDLVQLATTEDHPWLLILSTNPGGPVGTSGTWGIRGDFDGAAFTAQADPVPLDHGPDLYAAVTFSGVEGPPLLMGWAVDVEYAGRTPTAPWRGVMSLPRTLHPRGDAIVAEPVLPSAPRSTEPDQALDPATAHVLRIPLPRPGGEVELVGPDRVELRLVRDIGGTTVRLHRAQAPGADGRPLFSPRQLATGPLPVTAGDELVLVLDGTIAELVVTRAGADPVVGPMATLLFFPHPGSWRLKTLR